MINELFPGTHPPFTHTPPRLLGNGFGVEHVLEAGEVPGTQPPFWHTAPANGAEPEQLAVEATLDEPGTQPPFWQTAPENGALPTQPLVETLPDPGTQPPF